MDDRAKLAAALAKALGLERCTRDLVSQGWRSEHGRLEDDGSNVFSDPWFRLALEWLQARGYFDYWGPSSGSYRGDSPDIRPIDLNCPVVEFPARAIAKLMESEDD